jgi:hypothetical protein
MAGCAAEAAHETMKGGGSDAESSEGEARPLFRSLTTATKTMAGRRKSRTRTVEAVVDLAMLNYSSDDDDLPRARRAAALKNLRRNSGAEGGEEGNSAKATRKKRGAGAGAAEGGDSVPPGVKRARALLQRPEEPSDEEEMSEEAQLQEAARFLKNLDQENQDVNTKKRPGKAKPELLRKPRNKGGQTKVVSDNGPSPEKPEDDHTPEKEARMRLKAGKGGGKGKSKSNADPLGASDEEEDDNASLELIKAWEADLKSRVDSKYPDNLATAFSIKSCEPSTIRNLAADAFLGKKRPEEGGYLLIDGEGSINAHFMLGTHKQLVKLREREYQRGNKVSDEDKANMKYLRWLVVKALKFRVINKRELRQGKVNQVRIKAAQKSLRWSLSRPSNLADFSDNEGEDEISPEVKFKQKEKVENHKEIKEQSRMQLRSNVITRQNSISVSSSSHLNLEEMRDYLTAPSLSFDWEDKGSDDEEDLLEVAVPQDEMPNSRRNLFKDQLHRAASFHQAKGLSRTKSNLSRSLSSSQVTRTSSDVIRTISDVSSSAVNSGKSASNEAEPPQQTKSALWEVLEAEASAPSSETPVATEPAVESEPSRQTPAAQPEPTAEVAPSASKPEEAEQERKSMELASEGPCKQQLPAGSPGVDTSSQGGAIALAEHSEALENAEPIWQPSTSPAVEPSAIEENAKDGCEDAKASEACSAKAGSEDQDWRGITPTAMWSAETSHLDSTSAVAVEKPAGTMERQVDISPTMPFVPVQQQQVEISPTMPFVPLVAKETAERQVEISPTMPFVPKEATEEPLISPTAPFITKERPDISPTLPFEPSAGRHQNQVSAQQDQDKVDGKADSANTAVETKQQGTTLLGKGDSEDKLAPSKHLQEAALAVSEDSLSEPESDNGDSGDEKTFRLSEKQRRQEREWLRHKRRAAKQEAKDAMKQPKKRKTDKAQELGILSTQDLSSYQAQIDTNLIGSFQATSRSGHLQLRGGSTLDDPDEFDGFGGMGGFKKKKSFLMK